MKRLLLTFAICTALMAVVSFADEIRIGGVGPAPNILTWNNAYDAGGSGPGAKVAFAMRDGGCTYYRPGCGVRADGGVTCVVDAGPGDVRVCFGNVSDPYKVDLCANCDRIHFRGDDNTLNNTVDVYLRRP